MTGWHRITRREFYDKGAFANSRLCRVQRGKSWGYYERDD